MPTGTFCRLINQRKLEQREHLLPTSVQEYSDTEAHDRIWLIEPLCAMIANGAPTALLKPILSNTHSNFTHNDLFLAIRHNDVMTINCLLDKLNKMTSSTASREKSLRYLLVVLLSSIFCQRPKSSSSFRTNWLQ